MQSRAVALLPLVCPPNTEHTQARLEASHPILWAKEAGFEIVHLDAYHPHYITGEHKGFWNWTLRAVGLGMVKEGSLTAARLEELVQE